MGQISDIGYNMLASTSDNFIRLETLREANDLITNCIIFYNATILSTLLDHRESIGHIEGVAALKKVSPVAGQHINLHGRYEFTRNRR